MLLVDCIRVRRTLDAKLLIGGYFNSRRRAVIYEDLHPELTLVLV